MAESEVGKRAADARRCRFSDNSNGSADMKLPRLNFLRCLGTVFSLLLFSLLAGLPLRADELFSRTLSSDWQFRAVGSTEAIANPDKSDVKQWHPAQVPGVVQTDLLRNGLIPDPFDR